jgi:hypothetical protein
MEDQPVASKTPIERVAGLIRHYLRSAEVTDFIEPADPTPQLPEFDLDPRFYTPVKIKRAVRPFAADQPGVPTFRDAILEGIRELRGVMRDYNLRPRDCKGYIPEGADEPCALVYFRLDGYVLAALAVPPEVDWFRGPEKTFWDLILAVNVDDEAMPP